MRPCLSPEQYVQSAGGPYQVTRHKQITKRYMFQLQQSHRAVGCYGRRTQANHESNPMYNLKITQKIEFSATFFCDFRGTGSAHSARMQRTVDVGVVWPYTRGKEIHTTDTTHRADPRGEGGGAEESTQSGRVRFQAARPLENISVHRRNHAHTGCRQNL